MPSSHTLPSSCHWFSRLASALDPRSAPRLAWLLVGAILARGRRTVTSWIRAGGQRMGFPIHDLVEEAADVVGVPVFGVALVVEEDEAPGPGDEGVSGVGRVAPVPG